MPDQTPLNLANLGIALPNNFVTEQTTLMAMAQTVPLDVGATLNKPQALSPNISILQRKNPEPIALERAADKLHQDLLASEHKPDISTEDFTFDDGTAGKLLLSRLAQGALRVAQYHAIRVDHDVLTVLTLTDEAGNAGASDEAYRNCIRSLAPST